jgi:hypothetical protein
MRSAIGVLILTLLVLRPAASEGCGDKFQRVGRGARFQRGYVALHPACILLYARPQSQVAKALRDLEPALKRAGHLPLVVEQPAGIAPALKAGHFAVVMTDLADVTMVQAQALVAAVPEPSVLPILYKPTAERKAAVEKEFSCMVEAPGKQVDVLAEIDGLMERRIKSGATSAPPKK